MVSFLDTDRPTLKYLNRHVRAKIAGKWHDIGVELLDEEDETRLNIIKINNAVDAEKSAGEMLVLWLEKKPDASWDQLLQVFQRPHIGLNTLASRIEEMLIKGKANCMLL